MLKTYFKGFQMEEGLRTQPWTSAERDENERYYNFRQHPELIYEVLEDYKPWDHYEAIQLFYGLLAWVNGPESRFESNDCAFHGPADNFQKDRFPKELMCSGRLMFFFRELTFNLSVDSRQVVIIDQRRPPRYSANLLFQWFVNRSMELIDQLHQETRWACVAPELSPVRYDDAPASPEDRFGYQLSFGFWAWGDDEQETMENLSAAVDTILQVLKTTSDELPAAIQNIVNNAKKSEEKN